MDLFSLVSRRRDKIVSKKRRRALLKVGKNTWIGEQISHIGERLNLFLSLVLVLAVNQCRWDKRNAENRNYMLLV